MEDPVKLWQHLHGAAAHFPIACIMVALAFDYGSQIFKQPQWRTVSFWCMIVASVVAIPLIFSGFAGQLGWKFLGADTPWETLDHAVELHRNIALAGSITTMLLTIWRTVRRDQFTKGQWGAYLAIATLATGAIGFTGYLGAYVRSGVNSPFLTPPSPAPTKK
jgi:uncharacterized membrane protein